MSGAAAGADDLGGRDPRLDGLRGLAIALVVFYHTTNYAMARSAFDRALTVLPSLGWSGVDLFFVLSGFLITGILLRARRSPTYFRVFYARRVLRIFPLYYAVLVLVLWVVPHIGVLSPFDGFWNPGARRQGFWYWLYLSNLQVALAGAWQHRLLDITWSLAIEEHFYLLWPLAVLRCSERALLAICAATAAGALALRVALLAASVSPIAVYVLTPCRLDTLATGAAVAIAASHEGGLEALARPARRLLPVALAGFFACYAWVRLHAPPLEARSWDALTVKALSFTTRPAVLTLGFTLLCVVYGSLLVWVLTAPAGAWRARVFETRVLRRLGKYSYAIYLLHLWVAFALLEVLPPGRYPNQYLVVQLAFWALAFSGSYGLARLSWAVLEEPMLKLKRYFPYRL